MTLPSVGDDFACPREKQATRKEYASHHTHLGDRMVDAITVLSRSCSYRLPSREAILPDFLNSEEYISEEESSLTVSV